MLVVLVLDLEDMPMADCGEVVLLESIVFVVGVVVFPGKASKSGLKESLGGSGSESQLS